MVYVIQVSWQLASRIGMELQFHPDPACGIMHRWWWWPAASSVHYATSCNTQSSAPEDGRNHHLKHVELIGIINKPLLLHLVGCLYYLYQWCTVKQTSDIKRTKEKKLPFEDFKIKMVMSLTFSFLWWPGGLWTGTRVFGF